MYIEKAEQIFLHFLFSVHVGFEGNVPVVLTQVSQTGGDVTTAGQIWFVWFELRTTELHSGTENLTFEENCTLAPRVAEHGKCCKNLHRCGQIFSLCSGSKKHKGVDSVGLSGRCFHYICVQHKNKSQQNNTRLG